MRAPNSRSGGSIWRTPGRAGISIGLCLALVVSGLPGQAVRFVQTGHWTSADTVAYAAVTTTARVSLTSAGAQITADGWTWQGDGAPTRNISADGRYVVFLSSAANLPGPGNVGGGNVFVRDTQLGTTTLVSVNLSGGGGGGSYATISGDGRYVAFLSGASDLVSGDTNGVADIFVRDLTLGTTVRVSVDSSGLQGTDASADPYLSADGHSIAFVTSSNLGGPAPGGGVYLRDLTLGTTTLISVSDSGGVANDFSFQPSVSDDGRYVTFVSRASNIAMPKLNLGVIFDVYLRDRTLNTTRRVSVAPGNVQGDAQSNTAVVIADGSQVLFRSGADNLIAGDTNGFVDLFLRDMNSGAIIRVAENSDGGSVSSDGRFIVFDSAQSNLVPGDTNGFSDVFVRDQQEGSTELVSQSSSGTIGNSGGQWPAVTADGRYVVFSSASTNLVSGDTNAFTDVFVRDRGPVDTGAAAPYTYGDDPNGGYTPENVNVGTGVYTTEAVDLAMPGRLLPFMFRRSYNSSDTTPGPLGPAWSHSFFWKVVDAGAYLTLRRGDGQRDHFTRNTNGTYAPPPNVFDALVKNGDATFTLTLKKQTQYEFSTSGQLTRIHEPAGNQLTLTYTSGNLTSISDTVGRAVSLGYDTSNRLTQIQDPLGRKVTYAYDTNGRLATVTDKIGNAAGQVPAQHQWKYGYDGTTQHLTTVTDPDGRVQITNTYDATGRVYQQRDGLSQLTTITYNPDATVTVDARGNSSSQTYDTRKRALIESRVVSGQTLSETRAYDTSGNLTSVTNRNNQTTDYTYDTNGNMLTKTDPQVDLQTPRYLTQFAYDSKNNIYQVTDARNFVTTRTFDPTSNVLLSESKQIDATTYAVTKYEYGDAANKGMPTRIIAPRGNLTGTPDYAYATNLTYVTGNLVTRVDSDGAATSFTYDGAGRQITLVDPDASGSSSVDHTWITAYNENDQVKSQSDPMGGVLAYAYDGAGNRTGATDRDGNLTTNIYDANSRLFKVQQKPNPVGNPALIYTTQIDRDANGNPIHVTQGNGVVTDYGYDELDRLTSYSTHPNGSTTLTTTFTLDGDGNVITKTTPPGADQTITTSTYDAVSRLKTVDAVGLTTIAFQYDATSNRSQMTDETGTSTYQYDGLARLTQAAQPNGTVNYGYDRDGNRTSVVYPAAADTVTYTYTTGGRLDHVQDAAGRISTYTYTASGLAKTLTAPNGLTTSYQYDRAQRLTSVSNLVGTNMRTRHTYTLDSEGNRIALDEYVEGITTAPSTTWAASVKVNSDTGTTVQDHPAIALGADGGQYLIWDDARDGNANIYFSKRDPVSGIWSTPSTKVNTDTGTRIQLNPAIALDSASNAYAVWQDERNGAGKPDIFFRKRTAADQTWVAGDVKVSDEAGGGGGSVQRNPRIAGTAAGMETAVWVDLRSSQTNIYSARTTTPGGTAWAANVKLTDNTAALKDFPDVTVGLDGTAYAVWQDSRNGNPDIYFSKLPPGPNAVWTANVKVSDDPGTAAQRLPRIGVDAGGNLTVVWLDDRASPTKIRMSRLPSGASTWPASTVVADAAARPVSVALSVRADGKAYVEFGDNRVANIEIYGSEYDPWLNTWTASTLVSDDPGSAAQQNPTVAYGMSEIAAAWRDDRAGNADVRARRAVLTGTDHFGLGYDGLERLTGTTVTNPESFVLDAASNISSRTGPSATNTYDSANRLTSDGVQSYVWSQSDHLNSRGGDTFGFDALERLKSSAVAGTSRTYTYNGDGLLQGRTQGTATTFVWDPGNSPSGLLQIGGDRIIYGLGPIYAVKADTSTVTFARDGGKSIRAEINSSGAVTASFRYRVYGQVSQYNGAPSPNYLGYAGQLIDPTGLYYMRARWYDPSTGRFLSRDPVRGNPAAPMSLNGYGYGNASPTMNTDPTGLCIPPATIVCLIVALPTIEAGVIVVWTAAVAGIGVLTYVATHDQIFRAEAADKPVERQYEDIEKHGETAKMGPKGIISKRPKNGAGALENSEPVPGKERQRVGTDPDTGEEVQLRRHGEVDVGDRIVEKWHGWVPY